MKINFLKRLLVIVGTLVLVTTLFGFSGATASASQNSVSPKFVTENPTCGSTPGAFGPLTACVQSWSNGLTISLSGFAGYKTTTGLLEYAFSGSQLMYLSISCNGSSGSVFLPLGPNQYAGDVALFPFAGGGIPKVATFSLNVGDPGSTLAPPTSCGTTLPPINMGTVNKPVVDMARTHDGGGYWLVGADGSVQAFGDALYYGDMSGQKLNGPIVSMAPSADGLGYWLLGRDGGIFSFGDAPFFGSTGNLRLNKPVVGMTATPDGLGYYMDASDGGIFAFGDAQFHGSMGGTPLTKPVVGMSIDPVTGGYWEVAADGGIFSFNAPFFGSTGAIKLNQPIVGMTNTLTGMGYRFVASDGGIFSFGDAQFYGSAG